MVLILYCASKYIIHSRFEILGLLGIYFIIIYDCRFVVYGSRKFIHFLSINLDFLQFPACIALLFHSCCTQCARLQYLYRCSQIFMVLILYCASKYIIHSRFEILGLLGIYFIIIYDCRFVADGGRKFIHFLSIDLDFLQFPTYITLLFHSCCTQCTRLQHLYSCS